MKYSGPLNATSRDLSEQLIARIDLKSEQVYALCELLIDPGVPISEKATLLELLRDKGESGEEISYFAEALLDRAIRPKIDFGDRLVIDVCGTGGDRLELINVSTTAMFIVAAAGAMVVKHGNRSITSKSGGGDVLEALGIPITSSPAQMSDCLAATGVGFLLAPLYHPAFQAIAPVRKQLAEKGIATVFNLLGPLLNPARPAYQLVGVFSPAILEKYAAALSRLSRKRAWVVHGEIPHGSGMDELSPMGETMVHEVRGESLNFFHLFPDQLGIPAPGLHELRGGDAKHNAECLVRILSGEDRGPRRDFVLLNAAAALVITGLADKMQPGLRLAAELVDSGQAVDKLRAFQAFFAN